MADPAGEEAGQRLIQKQTRKAKDQGDGEDGVIVPDDLVDIVGIEIDKSLVVETFAELFEEIKISNTGEDNQAQNESDQCGNEFLKTRSVE